MPGGVGTASAAGTNTFTDTKVDLRGIHLQSGWVETGRIGRLGRSQPAKGNTAATIQPMNNAPPRP
jgi:hypothetical protein